VAPPPITCRPSLQRDFSVSVWLASSSLCLTSYLRAPLLQIANVSRVPDGVYLTFTPQPVFPIGNESFNSPANAGWVNPPPLTLVPSGHRTVPTASAPNMPLSCQYCTPWDLPSRLSAASAVAASAPAPTKAIKEARTAVLTGDSGKR
jgi:hypothetical protein